MATFTYRIRTKDGREQKGSIEGTSLAAVQSHFQTGGYIVMELQQDNSLLRRLNKIKFGTGIKRKDVAIFSRQFSTMITAGLSLTKCLSILAAQSQNEGLKEVIRDVNKDVESGLSLSDAMAKHIKVFPPIFINMVRAGETGGVLDEVLARVADHFEGEMTLKGKIKSAMTYPIAMLFLVLVILTAMLVFVVPAFEKMFSDMGGELPFITQMLVNLSKFVSGWGGLFLVGVTIFGVILFNWWKGTESGRFIWDSIKLRIPVVGPVVKKLALARFTRTLSTLVAAGVPILSALEIVSDTAGNEVVARAVRKARSAIKEGEPIYQPLSETPVFPPMLVQMVAVGEETGALDTVLNKVADFYDEEVANTVDGLTSIIEPVMMAVLGGIVGTMVIALYLPMFNIITLVQEQAR